MSEVYIDMDGTIVFYHDRFYTIYYEACIESGIVPIPKEDWIRERRNGGTNYPDHIFEIMRHKFEDPKYLKLDKLVPGMFDVIQDIKEKYPIKIVSFRANNKNLKDQLNNLKLCNFDVISQKYTLTTPHDEKAEMIRKVIPNPSGYIIGDTHFEIIAAKNLGLTSIAVNWGDQSNETLKKYSPDFIVSKPEEILDIIK